MASTYLTKTFSGSGNRKTFTISVWIKRSKLGGNQHPIIGVGGSGSYASNLYFQSGDQLDFWNYSNGSYAGRKTTNRKFRDTTGWYNIVVAVDTSSNQSTADDRIKIYVNGERITSFSTSSNPSQDQTFEYSSASAHEIGRNGDNAHVFDGYMSHFHFVDGSQLEPTVFGSVDSSTGQWKINTSPSFTPGTNGFTILKDGNTITDQSTNSNDFTLAAGTLSQSKDNPSQVFATLNPEECGMNSGATPTNGNSTFGTAAAQWHTEASTFGITRGKYYWETQMRDAGGDRRMRWGMVNEKNLSYTGNNKVLFGSDKNAIGFKTNGESATDHGYGVGSSETTLSGDINSDNGVYGFAIDYDNQKMWGSYNGSWLNSGDPTNGTNGIDVSSYYNIGDPLFPCWTTHNSYIDFNAGNGTFAGTALTGTTYSDVDGNGVFKYTVPTNFRCLSSKGINQ
tara:strand:+ start:35 stop:1390 length:1356 start_codon:yes stop_codon:yes gene_type:complete